jgi:predicted DNA-binding transcriptional regulator YafY
MRSQQSERGRNDQLLRVLGILRELDRVDGVDLYELRDRFGANLRTIRRDLDALAAAGIPLEKERDGKRFLPLRMFLHDRAVYLICKFMRHGAVGTLNLQRVRGLKVLDKRALPPEGFDPAEFERSAFAIHPGGKETTYVLRFHEDVAGYIRERWWHPSQTLRDLRGGGVELTFTCGESFEVTSWVASWREWVVVSEPKSLREELGHLGAHLAATYRKRE